MGARRKPKSDRTRTDARDVEHATRVRHLISLDATNVLRRLTTRRDEMITLFSRLRKREPMLEVIHSWFGSVGFAELAALTLKEQSSVNAFYESLGELRWYLQYTEDMPLTVRKIAVQHQRKLELAYARLIDVLGKPSADGAPVVDADVVVREVVEAKPALGSGR